MLNIKNSSVRRVLSKLIPFVIIPGFVILGALAFQDKKYAYISFVITVLSFVLFSCGFERKKTGSRRMVIVVVMVVLAVLGRFIPIIKPVSAIIILAGLYLGAEAGFLTGALTAVVSNFFWGQGPWTPFQMLSFGIVGLFAGLLSNVLKKNKYLLYAYGVVAGVLYSFIMDVWTVLWYENAWDLKLYLAALASAVPFTVSYAVSNVVFLWFLSDAVGRKLERLKLKYGV